MDRVSQKTGKGLNKTIKQLLLKSYLYHTILSKYNHEHDNKVILLMITDEDENWPYLAVKSISRLLKGITSNHIGDFYCLNCFHSHRTKVALKKHEKVYKDHDYCYVKMPDED